MELRRGEWGCKRKKSKRKQKKGNMVKERSYGKVEEQFVVLA